jgi:hypothetical protein
LQAAAARKIARTQRSGFCIQRINLIVLSFIAEVPAALPAKCMAVRPKSPITAFAFILLIAITPVVPLARAEQPPATTAPPAESNKKSAAPRTKPQIIYRLPRVSGYAAALHSQAKTPDNSLPIDPDMPVSLQISRAKANAAANAANQPSPPAEKPEKQSNIQPTQPSPSRSPNRRSNMRNKTPGKGHGPGNSHGDKSHKK